MNYIVYLAHGSQAVLDQVVFSILSYLHVLDEFPRDTRILVYCDRPELFSKLLSDLSFLKCEKLESDQIRSYRGTADFVHRVKIKVLQEVLRTHSGNMIFVDADTAFLRSPAPLFEYINRGLFVMHVRERQSRHFMRFLQSLDSLVATADLPNANGRPALRPSSVVMWNAGVIGLSAEKRPILNAVLTMTDTILPLVPKKPKTIRSVCEQFAFSYVFQVEGVVLPADQYIYHYWDFKEEFGTVLREFFAHCDGRPLMQMIEATARIPPRRLHQPKLEYDRLSRLPKLLRKLRGKRWEIPDWEI